MPRQGEGHIADNAVENENPIIHGAGTSKPVSHKPLFILIPRNQY